MECSICCDTMTSSSSQSYIKGTVSCSSCKFDVCRGCVQQYLLNTNKGPHCMSCKSEWTEDFVEGNLQKVFLSKTYENHKCDLMMKTEIRNMKETYTVAEHEKKRVKINAKLRAAKVVLSAMIEERRVLAWSFDDETVFLDDRIVDQKFEIIRILRERRLFQNAKKPERTKSIEKCILCPNGMIDTDGSCTGCNRIICKYCLQEETESHVCNPDDVETVKMLMRETKPCPGCSTHISKIDGCDQMFCVNCHTSFLWSSGVEYKGRIHNPHYYEYLREKNGFVPREPGDNDGCGDLNINILPFVLQSLAISGLNRTIKNKRGDIVELFNLSKSKNPIRRILKTYLRSLEMIVEDELPYWANRSELPDNEDLRVRFILNRITEKDFKKCLKSRRKISKYSHTICCYLESFRIVFEERVKYIWNILQSDMPKKKVIEDVLMKVDEITKLREYLNCQMKELSKKTKLHCCHISNLFNIHAIRPNGKVYGPVPEGTIGIHN